MDTLYKIGAFLGLLAFFYVCSLARKMRRFERTMVIENADYAGKEDMTWQIMKQYTGKEIKLDFYEDEADADMFFKDSAILRSVDEKWALLEIKCGKKTKQKLIRLSSIKGVSAKEK